MHGYGWWGMGWMWIIWLLIIVVLVFLVRWLIVSTRNRSESSESPEQILKRRYARGEIDREEFEQKLRDLREH